MAKRSYNVIGVMSGTSLDGVDIAYCSFEYSGNWTYHLHYAGTIPYSVKWHAALTNAIAMNQEELKQLDQSYSTYLGHLIRSFVEGQRLEKIDFVASHGHTVFHQPHKKYTYQIGNKQEIAEACQLKVICDFRVQDVQLGGQGAPLVPIGDELLFHDFSVCLNLGGFANVSYKHMGQRVAFDICPVNIVLNDLVSQMQLKYDNKGKLASSGIIHEELLRDLNAISYYQLPAPKSLGLEWVKLNILPLLSGYAIPLKDKLRTMVEHIAMQIGKAINSSTSKILVTGGGTYNTFLIGRIKVHTLAKVHLPDAKLIEFKEALIFAFLGVLRDRGDVNCLKSVTGAERDHCSGRILRPVSKINN